MRPPDDRAAPAGRRRLGYAAGGRRHPAEVSLRIDGRAAALLVIGPNGAGKSVLLRLLHGLLRADRGAGALGGRRAAARRVRAGSAMVFQRPVMLRRTALANMRLCAGPGRACRARRAAGAGRGGAGQAGLGGAGRPAGAAAVGRRAAAPGAGPRRRPGAGGAVPRRALRQPRPGGDAGGGGSDRRHRARQAARSSWPRTTWPGAAAGRRGRVPASRPAAGTRPGGGVLRRARGAAEAAAFLRGELLA